MGLTAGYHHYFGKDVYLGNVTLEAEDASFLPIAAAARFNVTEQLTFGADIGYSIGISPDANDGGFYYAPKVQFGVTPTLDIVLAYKSYDGSNFDAATIGLEFGL